MGVRYWAGCCVYFRALACAVLLISGFAFSESVAPESTASDPSVSEPPFSEEREKLFAPERANYDALLEAGKKRVGIQWAANQAGIFVRVGIRLFLFEDVQGSHIKNTFVSNFLYGGMLSASTLVAMHVFIRMYVVANRNVPMPLQQASYGVTLFSLALMWGHQISNAYYNGLSGGWIYVVSKLVMGVESHYNEDRSFSYSTAVPAMMFGLRLIFNGYRKRVSQQMRGNLDIKPPPCLREKLFITLYANKTDSFEVRLSRVPLSLRKANKKPVSEGCRVWNNLVKVMDRSRIDQLTLSVVRNEAGTALQADITDYRNRYEKQLSVPLEDDADREDLPWIEQRLTQGESRFGIHYFRSVFHPVYLSQLAEALRCYRGLEDKEAFRQCRKGTLYAQHEECKGLIHDAIYDGVRNYTHYLFGGAQRVIINCSKLAWLSAQQDNLDAEGSEYELPEPESWVQEGNEATFLYFDVPGPEVGHLVWGGSYVGSVLELRDGAPEFQPSTSAPVEFRVKQYRVSRAVSFAMNAEMNYLARYVPHAVANYFVVPAFEWLLPPLDAATTEAARDTLTEGQNVLKRYAPSWLAHFYEICKYLSE